MVNIMDTEISFYIALYVSIAMGFVVIVMMYSQYLKFNQEINSNCKESFRIAKTYLGLS